MKRLLLIVSALFLSVGAGGQENDGDYLEVLKKYSSDGYFLVRRGLRSRYQFGDTLIEAQPVSSYIDVTSTDTIINTLPIAVHEGSHLYTDIMASKRLYEEGKKIEPGKAYLYYIGSGQGMYVPLTPSFPFSRIVDEEMDSRISMRFKSLTDNEENEPGHGVYELLDEWNAYLWESQVCLELLPCMIEDESGEGYMRFFSIYASCWTGIAEFRFYLLRYCDYCARNYPEQYDKIRSNRALLKALDNVDSRTNAHINSFFRTKVDIARRLDAHRIRIVEKDDYLVFTFPDESSTMVALNSTQYRALTVMMKNSKYSRVISDLSLRSALPRYKSLAAGK